MEILLIKKGGSLLLELLSFLFQLSIVGDDDDDEDDAVVNRNRPPIGQLGDFISLAGYSSEDEELHTDHRLI